MGSHRHWWKSGAHQHRLRTATLHQSILLVKRSSKLSFWKHVAIVLARKVQEIVVGNAKHGANNNASGCFIRFALAQQFPLSTPVLCAEKDVDHSPETASWINNGAQHPGDDKRLPEPPFPAYLSYRLDLPCSRAPRLDRGAGVRLSVVVKTKVAWNNSRKDVNKSSISFSFSLLA